MTQDRLDSLSEKINEEQKKHDEIMRLLEELKTVLSKYKIPNKP